MIYAHIIVLFRFVIKVSIIYTPSSRNWIYRLQMWDFFSSAETTFS